MLISVEVSIEKFYRDFDFANRMCSDPVAFPHRYKEKEDIEVSGLISALFAYGRVELFMSVIERILSVMGMHPYEFVVNIKDSDLRYFNDIYYRFQKPDDIKDLIRKLNGLLREYGSLEEIFLNFYKPEDRNIKNGIEGFSGLMLDGEDRISRGYLQLFPLPSSGSACKRLNLFLRWMVRDKDVDFGMWKRIPKNKLVIPLDTHIAKISIKLGLTSRKTPDWKMAEEITESLKLYDADDPLKFDFVLCHMGMIGKI